MTAYYLLESIVKTVRNSLNHLYSTLTAISNRFLVMFNLKLLKERCPKMHLFTKIELGNNDFRNQRIQVSKNSYVAKNQTKMPVDVTFWFSTIKRRSQ